MKPRQGDRYTWCGVLIEVGEVDPGGRWAMIQCAVTRQIGSGRPFTHEWDKEQPTPGGEFPADWIREP